MRTIDEVDEILKRLREKLEEIDAEMHRNKNSKND
jgi:hypothetical protein